MRTVPSAWLALETARQQKHALLVHIWAVPGGRVSWTAGLWGSWTYSIGFAGPVNFTDVANYAGDWSSNSGNPITRSYASAAIEFDAGQIFRHESTTLDPHSISLQVDPSLQPFAGYVNRFWPLTFGITIYKVHRAGPTSIATVDNGFSIQVPVVDVLFVGYLNADDTLELNSAGLELNISPAEGGDPAKAKLTTQWDHVWKKMDRLVPATVFAADSCPKHVYSTGLGAAVDCNADMPSNLVTDSVASFSGCVVSGLAWGAKANGFFTQGLLIYTATDPVSQLDFTFTLDIGDSAQRVSGGNTYGDLRLEMFPPLMTVGAVCQAYKGCNRTRNAGANSCMLGFIPSGTLPPPPGAFTPGTLRVSLELFQTVSPTQNPKTAHVYISATQVWIVYDRNNAAAHNQIGNIELGAGSGNPWSPTWASQGSSIITSPKYTLASASPALAGPPAQDGYHVTIANDGANASVSQQPNASNGYVTIVKCPGGSAATFDFTIAWGANAGTAVAIGNLQNFGGTDIPIEHPSLETAR